MYTFLFYDENAIKFSLIKLLFMENCLNAPSYCITFNCRSNATRSDYH